MPAVARAACLDRPCSLLAVVAADRGLLGQVAVDGVVPNLALLVVVAAALVRGPGVRRRRSASSAASPIDLAPPADHVAGRWALALVVVGYLAGRVRHDAGSPVGAVLTVAAGSFVGTSIFALSGMLLHDPAIPVGDRRQVIPLGVLYDVLIAPFVLPRADAAVPPAAARPGRY